MSAIWIRRFGGVDARRLPEATDVDSLIKGTDGHITRGGEFEKRAAFVPTYVLPNLTVSGTLFRTFGLAATSTSICVFARQSKATFDLRNVTIPAGVTLIQLVNGLPELTGVTSWDLFKDKVYSVGTFADGSIVHNYDGTLVTRTATGAFAQIIFGTTTTPATADVKIGGVSVTGGPVVLSANPITNAAAIASAVNATTSSPDYTATSLSSSVRITSVPTGAATNGLTVSVVTTGGPVAFTNQTPVTIGGVDGYRTGTRYVRTIEQKMYTLSGQDLQFSSIGDPTDWSGVNGGVGYGFIDTSLYTSASEDLTAVVEFRGLAAVFSQLCIQIWTLDADPSNNAIGQRLRSTGTPCPRSLTQFGDSDMFYLAENGLRSLRPASTINALVSSQATTYAAGVRIDPFIVAKLRSLTEAERANVTGLIEPNSGNFWLIMKDVIFVYAYFPDEGISAWTVYNPGFAITDACVFNRRVYVRAADTTYVYGGLATGQATDATVAEAWSAYLNDGNPAMTKAWRSFDAAITGEWSLSVGMNLADTSVEDEVAVITRTTYNDESIGGVGASTHINLRFRSQGTGPAVLGAFALHYDPETEDDNT